MERRLEIRRVTMYRCHFMETPTMQTQVVGMMLLTLTDKGRSQLRFNIKLFVSGSVATIDNVVWGTSFVSSGDDCCVYFYLYSDGKWHSNVRLVSPTFYHNYRIITGIVVRCWYHWRTYSGSATDINWIWNVMDCFIWMSEIEVRADTNNWNYRKRHTKNW